MTDIIGDMDGVGWHWKNKLKPMIDEIAGIIRRK
jgi:hypothetical protein